jgi:hypothetical protein
VLQALTGAIHSFEDTIRGMDPETVKAVTAGIAGLGLALIGGGAAAIIAAMGPAGWLIGGILGLAGALKMLEGSDGMNKFLEYVNMPVGELLASLMVKVDAAFLAAVDKIADWGTSITAAIMEALNKVVGWLKSWIPGMGGGGASPTGGAVPFTEMPGNPAANRKIMEELGGNGIPGGTVAGPTGLLQKPGAWQSVPSTGGLYPGGVPPSGGGGGGGPAFNPISFSPNEQRSALDPAILAAIAPRGQQAQPTPINLSLNIDGRKIAESISAALATLMEFPNQAPYHDSFGGYAPPDQQFSST